MTRTSACASASAFALACACALLASSVASAAPKGAEAKAQFDKGVAAYQKNDFAGASDALGKSYQLEPDVETLFAWAQTERKLEHCDNASELYTKLLAADMPAENKAVVREKLDECQKILAAQAPKPPPPVVVAPVPVPPPPPPPREEQRAWWKDPVGGALVATGVVGLAVGGVFLVQAHAANSDKANASDYTDFQRLESRADSRGKIGVAVTIGGGVLLAGGIAWYVTHGDSGHPTAMTAWVAPDGGGVVALGRF